MKIFTWNISLTELSFSSPDDWDRDLNFYELLKIIEEEDPDIFTLQEMPKENFGKRFINYHYIDPVPSHSGYTGIFIRKSIKYDKVIKGIEPGIAVEVITGGNRLIFVGCHLYPYKQNAKIRLRQLRLCTETISKLFPHIPIIIAGDMNMREAETSDVLNKLNLQDAYLESPQDKKMKFSWDSRVNIYREDALKFVSRFDRIFMRDLTLKNFKLIANVPLSENSNHYISDHFGIVVETDDLHLSD